MKRSFKNPAKRGQSLTEVVVAMVILLLSLAMGISSIGGYIENRYATTIGTDLQQVELAQRNMLIAYCAQPTLLTGYGSANCFMSYQNLLSSGFLSTSDLYFAYPANGTINADTLPPTSSLDVSGPAGNFVNQVLNPTDPTSGDGLFDVGREK